MLRINQRLDKLGAMCSNFIVRGMLPGGHTSRQHMSLFLKPSVVGLGGEDEDDEDDGPVEGDNVLAHVILAQSCGTRAYYLTQESHSYPGKRVTIPGISIASPSSLASQIYTTWH